MKKILLFCLMAMVFVSCDNFEDPSEVKITVESTLGSLYEYDLKLNGEAVKSDNSYDVDYGVNTVTLDLFDPCGVYLSTTTKEVFADGGTERIKFYLYFIGTTGVSAE